MNPEAPTPNSAPLRCQHRSVSGRRFCRMPVSDPQSGLCFRHAASQSKAEAQATQAARLLGDTGEFRSAVEINRSLGELYKLLARDEIAPRRAAVMAYTCNLLLRTLPAIDRELHPDGQDHHEDMIIDVHSAVAQRALEARLAQDAALQAQKPQRIIIDMPGPTRD